MWNFTTGNAKFKSAEAIEYSDQSAAFVRVKCDAEFQGTNGTYWHETETELGHGLSMTEARQLAVRIRTARDPLAYANAVTRNEQKGARHDSNS